MTTYFTADTHFGHRSIITACGRPWTSIDAMDEALIQRWNETVRKTDEVWHLGDFAYRAGAERIREIFSRLNGRKHLVIGNHDHDNRTLGLPWASPPQDRVVLTVDGCRVILDHYAMRSWPSSHHGTIHLYGHSHGALPPMGNSLDVGVDADWDYRPVTLAQIKARLMQWQQEHAA